ncbi:MAG: M20/M25/M40 family metallo-hydrolase [Myxococcales bacterium]|nr:M20/M25/M40 family metallo-hydrolase [Myxococcales bacterium]
MSDAQPKKKKSKWRWLVHGVLLATLGLGGTLLYRGKTFENRQLSVPAVEVPKLDWQQATSHLSGAVRIRTISRSQHGTRTSPLRAEDATAFRVFAGYLSATFPKAHERMQREVIAKHSLLYVWPGSEPSLEPILIAGHMDVATVQPGTSMSWTEKPFSGALRDDMIWGRGTLDDKSFVVGLFEALEHLASSGYSPKRAIYVALSHDQMRGGEVGTAALAQALSAKAAKFRMVLTEGLAVVKGFMPEIPAPIAMVGVGEKGQASLLLQGASEEQLRAAQKRLEEQPLPAQFSGPAVHQFEYLAGELPFAIRVAVANRWLFSGLLEDRIKESEGSEALIRSLVTSTDIPPGTDEKTLPEHPVLANYRLRPGDSLEQLKTHAAKVVADPKVELSLLEGAYPAPPVSSVDAPEFKLLQEVIEGVFPESVFAPSLVLGATDARHYATLSPNIYRFRPLLMGADDMSRSRNSDERIRVEAYERVVTFCSTLVRKFAE